MSKHHLLVSGLLLAAGLAVWSPSTAVNAASPSASQLQGTAIQNAEASGWVHETVTSTVEGHAFSMVNEIGATEGRQVVTSNGGHAQVIVIDGNAYIYGDVKAVRNYFGLSSTDPQQYADKWLELTPSNPGFATVSAAVTLASDFGHVALPGHLTEGRVVTIDGHKVQPISAHIPATSQSPAGTATLYVTTTGRILPFEYLAVAKGVKTTTRWSDWGHTVSLAVPSPSTPLGQ